MFVGFTGFERLLKTEESGDALLGWMSSLEVTINSRPVKFVLVWLQRHLGVIYGIASLDKLDFVGGAAVDQLGQRWGHWLCNTDIHLITQLVPGQIARRGLTVRRC